jgi:PAS domain S-box-containing protein
MNVLRNSGLDIIGDVPWGTHFCQFYQTKEDLIDILVPYFKAGLEDNEFCMWITSEPLVMEDAKKALKKELPDIDSYITNGQILILPYSEWYVQDGVFDSDTVLNGWVEKLNIALNKGFDGLRLSGNTFWLEKEDWNDFVDYEEAVDNIIGKYQMIAMCTYSLDKCNANEVIDVVNNHQFALIKRQGEWALVESSKQKKIADELTKSEERYHDIFESMNEAFMMGELILDEEGNPNDWKYLSVNPAAASGYGMEQEQIENKRFSELFPNTEPPYIKEIGEVVLCGKPAKNMEFFSPITNNWLEVDIYPQRNCFFSVFTRIITERKKAEEELRVSENRLSRVLENLPVGVWITDLKGKVITKNKAVDLIWAGNAPLSSSTDDYVEYVAWDAATGKRLEAEDYPLTRTLSTGLPIIHTELRIRRFDGTEGFIIMSTEPLRNPNGLLTGAIGINFDITERKKAEEYKQKMLEKEQQLTEELSSTNEELQATSEELHTTNDDLILAQDSLTELVNRLKRSNKELEQFAYVASHDLQEPLRMVASFTQLLERRYKSQLDEDADDYIGFIVEGANRMKYLIDDLLAFSRLNTESKEFEPILMEVALDNVLINLKASIKDNKAQITHDPLPTINGDPSQIHQALQNLIANAIKFHGNKPPKIHISAEDSGGEWLFSIDDNGIGIDPEHKDQIFKIFKRLHIREEYPGTGIGLAICKRIVERHGGHIWVESEEGKGSTFYFTLSKT